MEIRTDTSQWTLYVYCKGFFKFKIIGGRRWIAGDSPAYSRRSRPRNGRPRPFRVPVTACHAPIVDTSPAIRRRFIDVAPMESSKVAYYTPMPRLWFLTGFEKNNIFNHIFFSKILVKDMREDGWNFKFTLKVQTKQWYITDHCSMVTLTLWEIIYTQPYNTMRLAVLRSVLQYITDYAIRLIS